MVIIDGADELGSDSQDALLKTLEEPPAHVVFVFATTEPQKIAQAAAPVLSRLQRFDLKLGFAVDVVVFDAAAAIDLGLTVLAHHDHRRLDRGHGR